MATTLSVPAAAVRSASSYGQARQTLITVGLGEVLVQAGLTPITAVLPALAAAIGVASADAAWILTLYILALAGTLLVSGRLGDLLGHRRIFGAGAMVMAGASLLAGLATSFELLLFARIAQGVGVAMVSGNNLAILSRAVPVSHRGKAIATVAVVSSTAGVLSAGLGTLAMAAGAWQLLFLAVVPLALWAAARARRLPASESEGEGRGVQVDWLGAGLLVLTITLVAVALNHPHTATSEAVMPVFHAWLPALAIVSAAVFIAVERRVAVPLMDWTQLRNAPFAASIGVNAVLHLTMMAALFLGPLLVTQGLGHDTTAGGMLMVVVQVSVVATAYLGGWLYDRTRSPWLRPGAAGLLASGLLAWAFAGVQGSYPGLLVAGFVAGMGSGMLLAVNNTVIMSSLSADSRGIASGLLETTRHFGHAFGVTIPSAIVALTVAGASNGEAAALRDGFFWSCLAMAALAALAIAPARIEPRR